MLASLEAERPSIALYASAPSKSRTACRRGAGAVTTSRSAAAPRGTAPHVGGDAIPDVDDAAVGDSTTDACAEISGALLAELARPSAPRGLALAETETALGRLRPAQESISPMQERLSAAPRLAVV